MPLGVFKIIVATSTWLHFCAQGIQKGENSGYPLLQNNQAIINKQNGFIVLDNVSIPGIKCSTASVVIIRNKDVKDRIILRNKKGNTIVEGFASARDLPAPF